MQSVFAYIYVYIHTFILYIHARGVPILLAIFTRMHATAAAPTLPTQPQDSILILDHDEAMDF